MEICAECGKIIAALPEEIKIYNFYNGNPDHLDIKYDFCHTCRHFYRF